MNSPQILMLGNGVDAAAPETLAVDVIADLVCPWCYLGKRRLDVALAPPVRGPRAVSWYPFQINPDMPRAGMPVDEFLETRFGKREAVQAAMDELTRQGRAEGVNFQFRPPAAHTEYAGRSPADETRRDGIGRSVTVGREYPARLLRDRARPHGPGRAGGNRRRQRSLADRRQPRTGNNDLTKQLVLSQEAQVRRSGITGVPGFLVNKRLYAIGAQSTESLVGIFDRTMFGDESDLPVSPVVH